MIAAQSTVTLHFALKTTTGAVIDSNFNGSPVCLTMGDGNLLPGFERLLLGLERGQQCCFTVSPEAGFGQPNPNNIKTLPRHRFTADMALQPGLIINFAHAPQGELPGIVQSVDEHQVVVDFNHPLAGHELLFEVKIIHIN